VHVGGRRPEALAEDVVRAVRARFDVPADKGAS
jgi:hypothetical protein